MFKARTVGIVLVGFVALSIIWNTVRAWLPPMAHDRAPHSYSARSTGYRGIFETLQALGTPVRRWRDVPGELFQGARRVVLLEPDIERLALERHYLQR
ncbi:MAG: DUF4350 domain-containing protein, partial [Candidatus Hydrogenedentes bacterium]|nr:DUF4350 domain-containing protein [Candidatus Hydrogenedentota bacterium]